MNVIDIMSDLEEDCKPALDAVASADNVTTQKKKMSPCSLSEGMTLVIQNGRKHIVEAQVQNDGEGGFRKPEENLGISRVERSNRCGHDFLSLTVSRQTIIF